MPTTLQCQYEEDDVLREFLYSHLINTHRIHESLIRGMLLAGLKAMHAAEHDGEKVQSWQ